jgi:hypothetical protein
VTTAYDELSTRAALDDVCDDLATTIGGEHDGHLLPRPAVQALYAFLSDLRDQHDEQAVDVEVWPTLSGFCTSMLEAKVPADGEGLGKPCDRPGCRAPHNWTGGRCSGNAAQVVVNVGDLADEVRAALRGEAPEPKCPECKAGKHINCDGQAWDDDADQAVTCVCREVGHR